ncbi:MAG: tetratricopeptide repeat protein [Candidatus Krumholzibacteria bacterium]|nr:tetratricopeptide repeat protein [Candidatus Krumholzibacteria bacterium]
MTKSFIFMAKALFVIILLSTAAPAQTISRIKAEGLFVEAQKALSRGDDQTAEILLKNALQSDESFTSAIWQLAQIYEKRGKLENARELILRGLQQEPQAAWAREKLSHLERILTQKLLTEAESFMSSGRYDRAIPKLSLYMGIKPYDPTPLIQLGRCHLALGNLDTAKEYLIQALERDPSNSQTASILGEINERNTRATLEALKVRAQKILADYSPENREKARETIEAILREDPRNSWASEKLGELDLLTAEEKNKGEKGQTLGKSLEAVKTLKRPFSRSMDYLLDHIFLVALIAVAVLLVFDIRRKADRRGYPLQGSLSLIPILDIVSLLNSNLKTGRLVISTKEARGEIFFDKGEIIHARYSSNDGKKAFHELMDIEYGKYFFNNHLPSSRHTISEPLSLLLLSMQPREEMSPDTNTTTVDDEKLFTTVFR